MIGGRRSSGEEQGKRFAARIEDRVRGLDFPSWVILRPAFFMENLVAPGFKESIDKGQLAFGIQPTTRLQMIAVQDIGKYGRLAFERHDQLSGRAIDIAGDELTMPEAARIISQTAGRPVSHFQVPIEQVRGFSDDVARMLEWFDEVGYNADILRVGLPCCLDLKSPMSLSEYA